MAHYLPNGNRRTFYWCTRCCAPQSPSRPIKRCGGCQLVAYCGRDCQSNDRANHKPLCKMFPVVNGINVLHTTGSWEEHLAGLIEQASRLPYAGTGTPDDYVYSNRIFRDPKVCYTCREARPELLIMCKCSAVCYCSKKCAQADRQHKTFCSSLNGMKEEMCVEYMKYSYILTMWNVQELVADEYRPICAPFYSRYMSELEVHIVTSTTYFDTKAWELIYHQDNGMILMQLNLVFIIQDGTLNPSRNHKKRLTQQECDICDPKNRRNHVISSSVHQKPYHMFFSSSEYSEPDMVIVFGVTSISNDIHSEISYRNMTFSKKSLLVLTDSTLDLVTEGAKAVNAARPIETLVPPILNGWRGFGSHRAASDYDAYAINNKYYLTCIRRK